MYISRLIVLESDWSPDSDSSIFAGLGLELKGLGLGLATYGLGLGSFFSKSFFKSTLQSAPVERVFSHGGIVNFAISHSSTVICCLHPEQRFIPIATQQCTIPVNNSATCSC